MSVYQHHFSTAITRLLSLFSIGQKGVDLFFVLSGFLITGILLRTKESPHYFKNFYIRRSLRIFPLYYGVVFICLLAGCLWSLPQFQWEKNWWYLFYLQNVGMTFWPGSVAGPGHFWSLAVEEHFYLFWPLVVLLFNRRRLVLFSLSLVIISILVRVMFLMRGLDVFTFTFCRMDTLAVGALLAILFSESLYWHKVVRWTRRLFFPVAAIGLASFFWWSGSRYPVLQAVKYTFFAVLCGFVLVLSLSKGRWNPAPAFFQLSWLRSMGKTSYAMYVFHPFIYGQILGRFYYSSWSPIRGMFWPAMGVEFIIAIGATILVSWGSWVFFEHPLVRLKDRFQYEVRN
jgi:peptidoglycan/LPS O-acetylase OafA/YrhL